MIERYLRYGGKVLGICGGMQMLGRTVDDPQGFEGPAGCVNGLGLLDLDTTLTADKLLDDVTGRLTLSRSAPSRLPCEATRSAWAARRAQRLFGRR